MGGHGYTYDLDQEGKKKLVKDVATTSGYFTGNLQRPNTVVQVLDILSLMVTRAHTPLECLLRGLKLVLTKLVDTDSVYKNLCIISVQREIDIIMKMSKSVLDNEKIKIGQYEVTTPEERSLLAEVLSIVADAKANKEHLIMVDLPGGAEGGLGNRLANKETETAEVATVWGDGKDDIISFVSRKDYENPETDFNKIVSATRWYFETNDPEGFYKEVKGYRSYSFGKVEPDKNYYGKLTPDVTYSKLYTKQPIKLLDKLFDFTVKKIKNPDGYLSAGEIRNIVSKDTARLIDTYPAIPKKNNLVSPVTKQDGRPVLIELINPVMMSYRVREFLDTMDMQLHAFLGRDENNIFGYSTFYDITDQVFVKEVNGKGITKLKLHPDFNQLKMTFKVPVNHPNVNKPVPILLSVGYDIPERNAFNSITDPNVKVWVITDTRNPNGLRYSTIVETEEFIYLHTSAVANLRVLTVAELNSKK